MYKLSAMNKIKVQMIKQ